MMGRAVIGRVVVSALVLISVAGCSAAAPKPNYSSVSPVGSASGSVAPSPSASATTTAIPTTGPNVRPGEKPPVFDPSINENNVEGAQSLGAYYWELVSWGYSVVDPVSLRLITSSTCAPCAKQIADLESARSNRESYRGGHIKLRGFATAANDGRSGAQAAVDYKISVDELTVLDSFGKTEKVIAQEDLDVRMFLSWTDTWRIVDMAKLI